MLDTMTVADLRKELEKYPDDMPVYATWEGQVVEFRKESFAVYKFGRIGEEADTLMIDVDQP